ncbi:hypothetical protein PENTCL1PPCAC_9551, partial [Pristionchus entomophagus]
MEYRLIIPILLLQFLGKFDSLIEWVLDGILDDERLCLALKRSHSPFQIVRWYESDSLLGLDILSIHLLRHILNILGRDHRHLDLLVGRSRNPFSDLEKNCITTSILHDDLLLGYGRRPLIDQTRL